LAHSAGAAKSLAKPIKPLTNSARAVYSISLLLLYILKEVIT
jgi:hypothetical protein